MAYHIEKSPLKRKWIFFIENKDDKKQGSAAARQQQLSLKFKTVWMLSNNFISVSILDFQLSLKIIKG